MWDFVWLQFFFESQEFPTTTNNKESCRRKCQKKRSNRATSPTFPDENVTWFFHGVTKKSPKPCPWRGSLVRGHIKESLGTHGYMKCRFSAHIKQAWTQRLLWKDGCFLNKKSPQKIALEISLNLYERCGKLGFLEVWFNDFLWKFASAQDSSVFSVFCSRMIQFAWTSTSAPVPQNHLNSLDSRGSFQPTKTEIRP